MPSAIKVQDPWRQSRRNEDQVPSRVIINQSWNTNPSHNSQPRASPNESGAASTTNKLDRYLSAALDESAERCHKSARALSFANWSRRPICPVVGLRLGRAVVYKPPDPYRRTDHCPRPLDRDLPRTGPIPPGRTLTAPASLLIIIMDSTERFRNNFRRARASGQRCGDNDVLYRLFSHGWQDTS